MTDTPRRPRTVLPRRAILGATVAAIGLVTTSRMIAHAADEGGEAGEGAALADLPPDIAFLTTLGLFEATHRIVAALVAAGDLAEAQGHLETSHHAFYEDIKEPLATFGGDPFEDTFDAFAGAVQAGSDPADIAAGAEALFAEIAKTVAKARPADVMAATVALVRVSAADFTGGVENGQVIEIQEYRDAWGFADVARRWLAKLADSADTTTASAAAAGLKAIEPAFALFPDLSATNAPGDPSVLHGAAARIEIAALRLG